MSFILMGFTGKMTSHFFKNFICASLQTVTYSSMTFVIIHWTLSWICPKPLFLCSSHFEMHKKVVIWNTTTRQPAISHLNVCFSKVWNMTHNVFFLEYEWTIVNSLLSVTLLNCRTRVDDIFLDKWK